MFLSSTCCGLWLYHCTIVDLFVGFHMDNLDDNVVSIREVISNPYSSICLIRFGILDILNILGLLIL